MDIGLPRGIVRIEPYDPKWKMAFEEERDALEKTFGEKILEIEHIGSTSVPGLAAKPIIDIIAAVESFDNLDEFIKPLEKLGYEYMPERMFPNRKFFPKGSRSKRTHHLNLVLKDDQEQWAELLLFRDYLRENPNTREMYSRLKKKLAEENAQDRVTYTIAKSSFIQVVIDDAILEYGKEVDKKV